MTTKTEDALDPVQLHENAIHLRRYLLMVLGAQFINPLAAIWIAIRMGRGVFSRRMPGVIVFCALIATEVMYGNIMLLHLCGLFSHNIFSPHWLAEAWMTAKIYPVWHARLFLITSSVSCCSFSAQARPLVILTHRMLPAELPRTVAKAYQHKARNGVQHASV